MNRAQPKIDRYTISESTHQQKRYGEISWDRALAWKQDKEKAKRRTEMLCRTCYYLRGRLAGQAFTEGPCGVCAENMVCSNTAIPKICPPCGKKTKLCVQCGADRELRQRRGEQKFTTVVAVPAENSAMVLLLPKKSG